MSARTWRRSRHSSGAAAARSRSSGWTWSKSRNSVWPTSRPRASSAVGEGARLDERHVVVLGLVHEVHVRLQPVEMPPWGEIASMNARGSRRGARRSHRPPPPAWPRSAGHGRRGAPAVARSARSSASAAGRSPSRIAASNAASSDRRSRLRRHLVEEEASGTPRARAASASTPPSAPSRAAIRVRRRPTRGSVPASAKAPNAFTQRTASAIAGSRGGEQRQRAADAEPDDPDALAVDLRPRGQEPEGVHDAADLADLQPPLEQRARVRDQDADAAARQRLGHAHDRRVVAPEVVHPEDQEHRPGRAIGRCPRRQPQLREVRPPPPA